ncbi:hypothetical protein PLEOSDRAFT_1045216 [Pleurotus ostreatus PC15]|uniref:DUF6589 domain-containing protein n=1 Tax=Pleurotus ostreatus (strain PC15) TaxID=1137138 RepID=A0A067NML9_PLEO1|nr:hypothetical protein PLEOSDRAFT_1045216 [Pleurotus ostreatus PC15]
MSHKWTCNAASHMAKAQMTVARKMMNKYPWFISEDNIDILFRVFSQRVDNQPNAVALLPSANRALQESQQEGMKNPITEEEIIDLAYTTFPHIYEHMSHLILDILLNTSEFDLSTYGSRDSELLRPPPPRHQLPTGPEHATTQFMLGTVGLPEASYANHVELLNKWTRQVQLDSKEEQMKTSLEWVVIVCGDQLTVDQLHGLYTYRAEDMNSYDRLDWIIPVFGWFHLQMAYASSLHKQYLGTARGQGLRQAFHLLNRKGLQSASIKGPFHHHLQLT